MKSRILTSLLLLALPLFCGAQQVESAATAASNISDKQYLVEVIVFNYTGPISANGEIWHRTTPIEFTAEDYVSSTTAGEETKANPVDETEGAVEYTELKELLPFLSKLLTDRRYVIVTFTAWTQPLYGKSSAIRVNLVPPVDPLGSETRSLVRPALGGSIQLFENRLLFVDLDLQNELNIGNIEPVNVNSTEAEQRYGTFRIREKRRVKLNEVHYFDHPLFGALVRVSRAQTKAQ